MALPKIKLPEYKHKLHGLGKEVSYRPFTNAEQKILLLAKQSEDKKQIITGMMQILRNCVLDDIDVEDLTVFDIEDLFLRIRAKSVGEIIEPRYRYDYTDNEGAKKSEFINLKINIDDIALRTDKVKDKKVILDEESQIGVVMQYPTFKMIQDMKNYDDDDEMLYKCVECVFDADQVYDMADVSKEEFDEWVEGIDINGMVKINQFFQNMPHLYYKATFKVKATGEEKDIEFKGIKDFFI